MLTGVIDNTNKPVIFTVNQDDFRFCFMTDAVSKFGEPLEDVELPNKDGFVFGRTHDNHQIAIYTGEESINVKSTQGLITGAYIVSKGNITHCDIEHYSAISFVGGTLNRVFHANRIEFDAGSFKTKTKDDKVSYTLEVENEVIIIEIQSNISVKNTQDGNYIENTDVTLTMKFENQKGLNDVIRYYRVIKKTLSFMCYRQNVGFDKIRLLADVDGFPGVLMPKADYYINDEKNIALKDWQTNICISDLGESFPNLLKLFFDESEESQAPIIGFLPENDKDMNRIYPGKVKEICSSLESEYKYVCKEETENDLMLKEIQNTVFDTLSNYKKANPNFPESSYNLLKGSVKNWSLSLRDRIIYLYQRYSEEILLVNESTVVINESTIQELVRYRNAVTHRGFAALNTPIIETSFYLQVIVYCSVLERIGMTREAIKALCPYRLLR